MATLTNEKKRRLAERMFIEDGMSAKAIALALDVAESTISRSWRRGRKGEKSWDDRRTDAISAPHRIKELILEQMELVSSGKDATVNADALAKLSKVLETLTGKISVQVVMSVFKEFDNWMSTQEPEMAIKFLEFHKDFIMHKASTE